MGGTEEPGTLWDRPAGSGPVGRRFPGGAREHRVNISRRVVVPALLVIVAVLVTSGALLLVGPGCARPAGIVARDLHVAVPTRPGPGAPCRSTARDHPRLHLRDRARAIAHRAEGPEQALVCRRRLVGGSPRAVLRSDQDLPPRLGETDLGRHRDDRGRAGERGPRLPGGRRPAVRRLGRDAADVVERGPLPAIHVRRVREALRPRPRLPGPHHGHRHERDRHRPRRREAPVDHLRGSREGHGRAHGRQRRPLVARPTRYRVPARCAPRTSRR